METRIRTLMLEYVEPIVAISKENANTNARKNLQLKDLQEAVYDFGKKLENFNNRINDIRSIEERMMKFDMDVESKLTNIKKSQAPFLARLEHVQMKMDEFNKNSREFQTSLKLTRRQFVDLEKLFKNSHAVSSKSVKLALADIN